MVQDKVKLISVGKATTRICPIRADLIRKIIPDASRDTILYGKWEVISEGEDGKSKALLLHIEAN